jgi:hypothetical protein
MERIIIQLQWGGGGISMPVQHLKIQYDDVEDNSTSLAVAGDSKAITIGIDMVF